MLICSVAGRFPFLMGGSYGGTNGLVRALMHIYLSLYLAKMTCITTPDDQTPETWVVFAYFGG